MEDWAITIRKNAEPRTEFDYTTFHQFMLKSNPRCKIVSQVFELNKNGQTGGHIHAYIQIPKGYYRKRLCAVEGYHIKLVKINNLSGWIKYMNKDQSLFQRFENSVKVAHLVNDMNQDEEEEEKEPMADLA